MNDQPKPSSSQEGRRARIAAVLSDIGFCLPGSVVTRQMRCGKANCRCHASPPQLHGPYHQWTRKVDGKTVTRWLRPEQAARYEPWFANARQLRELVTELEALSLDIAQRAEAWVTQPPPKGHSRSTPAPRIAKLASPAGPE